LLTPLAHRASQHTGAGAQWVNWGSDNRAFSSVLIQPGSTSAAMLHGRTAPEEPGLSKYLAAEVLPAPVCLLPVPGWWSFSQ